MEKVSLIQWCTYSGVLKYRGSIIYEVLYTYTHQHTHIPTLSRHTQLSVSIPDQLNSVCGVKYFLRRISCVHQRQQIRFSGLLDKRWQSRRVSSYHHRQSHQRRWTTLQRTRTQVNTITSTLLTWAMWRLVSTLLKFCSQWKLIWDHYWQRYRHMMQTGQHKSLPYSNNNHQNVQDRK